MPSDRHAPSSAAPPPRAAAIITVGDELVGGDRVDTNSAWLSQELLELGLVPAFHLSLPDDRAAIAGALRDAAGRVDLILVTGGLGPTEDDLSRQALADALGEELVNDADALAALQARFAKRGIEMPRRNVLQTQRPASATMIPNGNGTAPGLAASIENCPVFVMPGVPGEMKLMWRERVRPAVARLRHARSDGRDMHRDSPVSAAAGEPCIVTTWVHAVSLAESKVGELLEDLMARDRNPTVGTAVRDIVVSIRVRGSGSRSEMENLVTDTARAIEERLGVYAFGRDGDTLASVVLNGLVARGAKLVTAESCTGGLLGAMLTEMSGSSKSYLGGWVAYANAFKTESLDVAEQTLAHHGAVSGLVADQMALGALANAPGATDDGNGSVPQFALAITGIAGPEGGSEHKPVGTVYITLAFIDDDGEPSTLVKHFRFPGDRETIRIRAAVSALAMLHFFLANDGELPEMLGEYRPVLVER